MSTTVRSFVIREISDIDADTIVAELQRVERAGHTIADVRHDGGVWRIFVYERRLLDPQLAGALAFRRRATD